MSEETLKPFDYAAYLAGAPVRTRDGRKVLELYMAKTPGLSRPLAVWLDGVHGVSVYFAVTAEGKVGRTGIGNCSGGGDLFMATVKKSVWFNLFKSTCGDVLTGESCLTREKADLHAKKHSQGFIKTIEVEYEE